MGEHIAATQCEKTQGSVSCDKVIVFFVLCHHFHVRNAKREFLRTDCSCTLVLLVLFIIFFLQY